MVDIQIVIYDATPLKACKLHILYLVVFILYPYKHKLLLSAFLEHAKDAAATLRLLCLFRLFLRFGSLVT